MPKITFASMDEVPEDLREVAQEENGTVTVHVVPKTKLDEFRDNNIKLAQERDNLKEFRAKLGSAVGEKDPDAFLEELSELRQTAQKVQDGQLSASEDIQKMVDERVAQMRADYEEQLRAANGEKSKLNTALQEADQRYRRTLVDRAVTDAVLAQNSKARPEALPDIMARAYEVFEVQENGQLIPKSGQATLYGADGTAPMTPTEWLDSLRRTAPYFFKDSAGGGAAAGNNEGLGGMSRADFDKLSPSEKLKIANRSK
jgi:hypothetical protein